MSKRIAFIQATWHADIVDRARQGFLAEVVDHGFSADDVDQFAVPGAFEIPLHAQRLARSGKYAAIVGAALVVDGEVAVGDERLPFRRLLVPSIGTRAGLAAEEVAYTLAVICA